MRRNVDPGEVDVNKAPKFPLGQKATNRMIAAEMMLAIDPDAPASLLQGRDSLQRVRPITTGIKPVDRMGIMEVLWYTRQLKRIAQGGNPRPNESGLMAFLKSFVNNSWGTYRTKRMRA